MDSAWVVEALRRFEREPLLKLQWASPLASSTFLIDTRVWRALEGYERVEARGWSGWADSDLDLRVRALGYCVAGRDATRLELLRPSDVAGRRASTRGEKTFRRRWRHWTCDPVATRPAPISFDPRSAVVYTAITGGYDDLKPVLAEHSAEGVDFVAYLDRETCAVTRSVGTWQIREIEGGDGDPCRAAKIYKILPHVFFPDKEFSLWIDGSVVIKSPLSMSRLVELFLGDSDLCVFRHGVRDCAYVEAARCKRLGLDDGRRIDSQVARYRKAGYPERAGLAEAAVLLRRHTPAVRAFGEAWWGEIVSGSRRDQISFNYAARSLGIHYAEFPVSIRQQNGLFRRLPHVRSVNRGPAVPVTGNATRRGARRRKVAIGPVLPYPSWYWVGGDMVASLAARYEIELFESTHELPECDVALIVKRQRLGARADELVRRELRMLYLPVDFYESEGQVHEDAAFLSACSAVVIHCERLRPYVQPYCRNVWRLDHYDKYGLDPGAPYRADGPIVWIGHFKYTPYVLKWAQDHPPPYPLHVVSSHAAAKESEFRAARELADRLGVPLEIENGAIDGHRLHEWSPQTQRELLSRGKAAIDVKGGRESFNQFTKPPTKAQQFVLSGLPLALNVESYSYEYLSRRGLRVASPLDLDRWFSEAYWREIARARRRLRPELALGAVSSKLCAYIEGVLELGAEERRSLLADSSGGLDGLVLPRAALLPALP